MRHASRRTLLFLASAVAVSSCATEKEPVAYDYDAANRMWWAGRPEEAFRMMLPLAENGNARAQFYIGCRYIDGWGVARDETKAVEWITKAAQGGNAEAQFNLGVFYRDGRHGKAKDPVEARKWFELAAEQGYGPAKPEVSPLTASP